MFSHDQKSFMNCQEQNFFPFQQYESYKKSLGKVNHKDYD